MAKKKTIGLSFTGSREAIQSLLEGTATRCERIGETQSQGASALALACRQVKWFGNDARIEIDHPDAPLMAMVLERAASDRGVQCREARCGADKSRVLVTLRDRHTGAERQLALGVLSEFNIGSDSHRHRFLTDWIAERANPQTNMDLALVRYEYLTDRQWYAFEQNASAAAALVKPGANTKLALQYTDAHNYKQSMIVVLGGSITQEQLEMLQSKLNEGEYIIADQVGLPTPAEKNRGYDGWPNEELDHVFTRLANLAEAVQAEELHTTEAPTIALHVDELAARFSVLTQWDIEAEQRRQRRLGAHPSSRPSP